MNPAWLFIYQTAEMAMDEKRIRFLGNEFAQKNGLPCPSGPLVRGTAGKPSFQNSSVHFSISHSKNYGVLACFTSPLGVDLQYHQTLHLDRITKRFFHPLESAWIGSGDPDRFYMVWTAKESYVKFTGQGIDNEFPDFSVISSAGQITGNLHNTFIRHIPFKPEYTLCICTDVPAAPRFIWL